MRLVTLLAALAAVHSASIYGQWLKPTNKPLSDTSPDLYIPPEPPLPGYTPPRDPKTQQAYGYCGTPIPTEKDRIQQQLVARQEPVPFDKKIVIDNYFHFVTDPYYMDDEYAAWYQPQLDEINRAFAPANIQFKPRDIQWWDYDNDMWEADSRHDHLKGLKFRRKAHRGTYASLNVYIKAHLMGSTRTQNGDGVTGKVNGYPTKVDLNEPSTHFSVENLDLSPGDYILDDGVEVDIQTMPGGMIKNSLGQVVQISFGRVLVHHIGHWLGLYEIFHGGCDEDGDGIADTPPQLMPTMDAVYGCNLAPENYNSCPDSPGYDSVHNYMNFIPDGCRIEWTKGQMGYMRQTWFDFRDPHVLQDQ